MRAQTLCVATDSVPNRKGAQTLCVATDSVPNRTGAQNLQELQVTQCSFAKLLRTKLFTGKVANK